MDGSCYRGFPGPIGTGWNWTEAVGVCASISAVKSSIASVGTPRQRAAVTDYCGGSPALQEGSIYWIGLWDPAHELGRGECARAVRGSKLTWGIVFIIGVVMYVQLSRSLWATLNAASFHPCSLALCAADNATATRAPGDKTSWEWQNGAPNGYITSEAASDWWIPQEAGGPDNKGGHEVRRATGLW